MGQTIYAIYLDEQFSAKEADIGGAHERGYGVEGVECVVQVAVQANFQGRADNHQQAGNQKQWSARQTYEKVDAESKI